jgi:hypothetical protein
MKKQTALDWLETEFVKLEQSIGVYNKFYELIEKAKEIEKEQIESAYNRGTINGIDYPESTLPLTGEQYYKKTFKK